MSKLRNREYAECFYSQLFAGKKPDDVIEVRLLGKGRPQVRQFDKIGPALDWVEDAGEDIDCYIGVALRKRGEGSGKSACTRVGAVWVDLDAEIDREEAEKRFSAFPTPPSCVVRTGHGYHAYWLLVTMAEGDDLARVEAVNRGIAQLIGGDVACHDISRIMRVPGSINYKRTSVQGKFVAKVVPDLPRFLLEQLEGQLDICRSEAGPPPGRIPGGMEKSEATPPPAEPSHPTQGTEPGPTEPWEGVEEGRRNQSAFALAIKLRRYGQTEQMCARALRDWNRRNRPPLPDAELCSVIHSVYHGPGAKEHPPVCTVSAPEALEQQPARPKIPPDSCWQAGELKEAGKEPVQFTVDAIVPARGVTILSGEGGIGKSFLALDLAVAVAAGRDWVSKFPVMQGPVLYIDLENDEATIGRRLVQLCAGMDIDIDSLPLYIPKRGKPGVELMLDTPEGRAWLWGAVEQYSPRLVIIDSLIAAHQGDENSNVLMRQLIGGLDGIAREGRLGIVVIHHQRKRGAVNDAGQLMRGASDLRNSIVSHLAARRQGDDEILCQHDKCRPARPSKPFMVKIAEHENGSLTVDLVAADEAVSARADSASRREAKVTEALGALLASRSGQLQEATGLPRRTLTRTLRDMLDKGLLLRSSDGVYRLAQQDAFEPEDDDNDYDPVAAGREAAEALRDC